MHHAIRTLALLAAAGLAAGQASAQVGCPGGSTRITGTALQTLISGNTVCAASSNNSDTWQEFHQGVNSGVLIDWKLGPGHPVDPTTTVGSWSTANDLLTHNYPQPYAWMVCQPTAGVNNFTLVSMSGAATVNNATVKAGQGACASLTLVRAPGRAPGR